MRIFDLLHKLFHAPYKLRVVHDTKEGKPVILLHGIASDSGTWNNILPLLPTEIRAITIDLLGFGTSPKPKNNAYATIDHVNAVVKTIKSLQLKEPVVLVGHSMGSLIAVDIAKRYPKLVSSLVLISTPLYNPEDIITATSAFSPKKNILSNGLFIIYEKIINNEETSLKTAQAIMKIIPSSSHFYLTRETWVPFKKSLTNTIMRQTSLQDILGLSIPITLFYGKLDVLLQQKNYDEILVNSPNLNVVSYTTAHLITKSSAKIISAEIVSKRLRSPQNSH